MREFPSYLTYLASKNKTTTSSAKTAPGTRVARVFDELLAPILDGDASADLVATSGQQSGQESSRDRVCRGE